MATPSRWANEIYEPTANVSFGNELPPLERCATDQAEASGRGFPQILGDSAPIRYVLSMVRIVGPADATVLISGETGTGKELIAQAIHTLSGRSSGPLVKVNCAAMPAGLLESELFGHERGAFTGAIARRVGRFELASRGTIFLDEVGEIPLELQAKLLRVLQEREFERLGSSRTLKTNARVVAATNRKLSAMVSMRQFRADLYYRLNVFPIELPPLRDRVEDVPPLVCHFVQQFSRRMKKNIHTIAPATMDQLMRYDWPGNVRELQNIIERAVILADGPALTIPDGELPPGLGSATSISHRNENLRAALDDLERRKMVDALEKANWKVSGSHGAAVLLGMKRTTLLSRMQRLGISVSRKPTSCGALVRDPYSREYGHHDEVKQGEARA